MRIRKNARLITSSSSSSKPFLVCQLNRSPWDVDSSFLGECDNGFDATHSLAQGFPSSNSLFSVESMELSYEHVQKTMPPPPPSPQLEIEEQENEGIGGHNDANSNRNNGWQHIHHQLKPPPLKVGPPLPPVPTAPKKRGRPKKTTQATTTTSTTTTTTTTTATPTTNSKNPYEFYYYSGFGPSWSRRRGGNKKYTSDGIGDAADGSNCGNTRINEGDNSPGCSSSSLVMSEDDVKVDDESNHNNVVVMESVVEGELDYIEDDFDDDDEEDGSNLGRRRVRKPVKARSLKSLM